MTCVTSSPHLSRSLPPPSSPSESGRRKREEAGGRRQDQQECVAGRNDTKPDQTRPEQNSQPSQPAQAQSQASLPPSISLPPTTETGRTASRSLCCFVMLTSLLTASRPHRRQRIESPHSCVVRGEGTATGLAWPGLHSLVCAAGQGRCGRPSHHPARPPALHTLRCSHLSLPSPTYFSSAVFHPFSPPKLLSPKALTKHSLPYCTYCTVSPLFLYYLRPKSKHRFGNYRLQLHFIGSIPDTTTRNCTFSFAVSVAMHRYLHVVVAFCSSTDAIQLSC